MLQRCKELYIQYKEIINYLIVGGLTTVVSLVSYYVCVLTFLDPNDPLQLQIANVISWILAVSFAYITNRKYVFESKNSHVLQELTAFFGARVATLLLDMGCMALMVSVLHMNDKFSKILVQFIIVIANYLFSKFLVFRKNTDNP